MSHNDVIVVEAHSDDSAISAGGLISHLSKDLQIYFLLITASDLNLNHCGQLGKDIRSSEYNRYVRSFNGIWYKEDGLPLDAESTLDMVPRKDLVSKIEKAISRIKPKIMILQGPSFHHDHSIVYESAIAATRPTSLFCPDEIYVMENPTYVHSLGPSTDFKPDFYLSMNEHQLQHKLDLFAECFPSQIRDSPNYLSLEGIRAWARYRGIEARCQYAEAFSTYRRVVRS